MRSSPGRCLPRPVRSRRSARVKEPTPAGVQPPASSRLLPALAHRLLYLSSRPFLPARRFWPSPCLFAVPPPPSALDARLIAAVAAGLELWPERKKRRKRDAPPGPCRSQRPGPATAPAPPPPPPSSPERTRPAWTGMGVRAAPSCAAAPAAAGAEQCRCPRLWPPPLLLLLLPLLLSLGLPHAGRRGPGGEWAAAQALFCVGNATALAGEHGVGCDRFTAPTGAPGRVLPAASASGGPGTFGFQRAGRTPRGCMFWLSAGVFTGARCGSGFRRPGRLRALRRCFTTAKGGWR